MILDQPSIRAGATGATGSYTLSSSTPILPFAGYQLVVAGAVGNPNDYTELLLGLGNGTFANSLLALGQQPLGLGAVDLDGDGLPDLLIGGVGGLAVFKNVAVWPALH
jgi:hypothetical protein